MRARVEGEDWHEVADESDGDNEALSSRRAALQDRLASLLGADRLAILTGLGTSLGITNDTGAPLAPRMADLWDALTHLEGFEEALALAPDAADEKQVELLLSRCHFAIALERGDAFGGFVAQAEATIIRLCRFVGPDMDLPEHSLFLRKVARRATRLARTQLFTTNYDLAFDYAADQAGFHLIDGFGLGKPQKFDGTAFDLDFVKRRPGQSLVLEANVAQYFKMHGSVDWDAQSGEIVRSADPASPVLIFPAQEKFRLSYERPYLECMARFQMALRESDVGLIVIGFGFNDAHVNAPIRAAVQANVGLRLVVVVPEAETGTNPMLVYLRKLVELGDRRITLLAGSFADFTNILPDLAPPDERELHLRRVDDAEHDHTP